jgi:hypothetical protein
MRIKGRTSHLMRGLCCMILFIHALVLAGVLDGRGKRVLGCVVHGTGVWGFACIDLGARDIQRDGCINVV